MFLNITLIFTTKCHASSTTFQSPFIEINAYVIQARSSVILIEALIKTTAPIGASVIKQERESHKSS